MTQNNQNVTKTAELLQKQSNLSDGTPHNNTLLRRRIKQEDVTSTKSPQQSSETSSNNSIIPKPNGLFGKLFSLSTLFKPQYILAFTVLLSSYFIANFYNVNPFGFEPSEPFIKELLNSNEIAPFEFNNYPRDTPYELRDVSSYSSIIAIGDLHGDLTQTYKILQLVGILNKSNKWIANNTILIQTGDIVDRGTQSIEIYLLFMKLREIAQKHHSLVLQLLGNHEFLNLNGDYRYVSQIEYYKYGVAMNKWSNIWNINNKIGYFLRKTPIIRIIGDTLFVHAGLRAELMDIFNKTDNIINDINNLVLKGLTVSDFNLNNYYHDYYNYISLTGINGAVWTRQYEARFYDMNMFNSIENKKEIRVQSDIYDTINEYICEQLNKTLNKLNVSRMVIGHNIQATGTPQSKCDGKLWSIDVGMSCAYSCKLGAIKIDIESNLVSVVS